MEKKNKPTDLTQLKEKLSFKNIKKDQLLILLLAGVLLVIIVWPSSSSTKNSKEERVKNNETGVNTDETTMIISYTEELESRLKQVLSKVDGVGEVDVMITLKASSTKVVEKDIQQSNSKTAETDSEGGSREITEGSTNEGTVYTEDESGIQTPYVIKELEPEIEGVIVIAEGGGNAVTVQNISEAVMALFEVSAHKIKVMKMN